MSEPEISVVIPSHARPELLRRAITTAVEQEDVALEVVVVDDGSPLPAEAAVAGLDLHGRPLRILRNERPSGVSNARNRGVGEANAPWVALLDDDDLWSPRKLRRQLDALSRTGARWSHTGTLWLDEHLQVRFASLPGDETSTAATLRRTNYVGTPSGVVAERAAFDAAGGFDPSLSVFADWDMWLRLSDAAGDGVAVREPLIGYLTHPGSMHRTPVRPLVAELRTLGAKHADAGPIGDAEIWRWIFETARDRGARFVAAGGMALVAVRFRDRRSFSAIAPTLRGITPDPWWALPAPPAPEWVTRWR